jgi:apolipoprotein N-acyltransferase
MSAFIELMQAGALIMLLFATVLVSVVIRNTTGSKRHLRIGPGVIGLALLFFAVPIYAAVIGASVDRFSDSARIVGAILLPLGLYLLGSQAEFPTPTAPSPDDDE